VRYDRPSGVARFVNLEIQGGTSGIKDVIQQSANASCRWESKSRLGHGRVMLS
jgi:hypothetical protein